MQRVILVLLLPVAARGCSTNSVPVLECNELLLLFFFLLLLRREVVAPATFDSVLVWNHGHGRGGGREREREMTNRSIFAKLTWARGGEGRFVDRDGGWRKPMFGTLSSSSSLSRGGGRVRGSGGWGWWWWRSQEIARDVGEQGGSIFFLFFFPYGINMSLTKPRCLFLQQTWSHVGFVFLWCNTL